MYITGFVVVDGDECILAAADADCNIVVFDRFLSCIPRRHSREMGTVMRFCRVRMNRRFNYIRLIAERASQHYASNGTPNISQLVLACTPDFSVGLCERGLLDPCLEAILTKIEVNVGGESGLQWAIEHLGNPTTAKF